MANPPPDPEIGHETAAERDRGATTGPPRWVKVFGIIALVVVVVFVVLILTGRGGGHGPGRHTPPSGIPAHGAQQP